MLKPHTYSKQRFTCLTSYEIIATIGKSIFIKIWYENNRVVISSFKIRSMDDICNMINTEEAVNLDNCYIKDFDYSYIQQHCGTKAILQDFSARGTFFDGDTSFAYAEFGAKRKNFRYAYFGKGNVNFSHAKFKTGMVDFYGTQFSNGDITFARAVFGKGEISFDYVNFGDGRVSFYDTHFEEGGVDFCFATFGKGDIDFEAAIFNEGRVYFYKTTFDEGNISFFGAVFNKGRVDFRRASFGKGNVDFRWAEFQEGIVTFRNAHFSGKSYVNFQNIEFSHNNINFNAIVAPQATLRFHQCSLLQHDDFRAYDLGILELSDCILERTLLLNSTADFPVNIRKISFADTKNLATIYIDWLTARDGIHAYGNEAIQAIKQDQSTDRSTKRAAIKAIYRSQAKQFQMLKENYHNLGEYDHEDEAFVEYMRSDLKTRFLLVRAFLCVLDILSAYGTKPLRLSCWMGIVITTFAGFYTVTLESMGHFNATTDLLERCYKGLYISSITFLTIGDNRMEPASKLAGFLYTLEGFIGLFLMSYFIVALVRKTLR